MGQGAGLTARQKQLLDLVIQEPYFRQNFYLTGGTALSSWYLHHRESYDLDFFCEKPFDYDKIIRWFRQNEKKIKYRAAIFDEDFGFLEVKIRYPKEEFLKADFHKYSVSHLKRRQLWKGFSIDSLYDITVNKLQTISERPRARDYVDLYFVLQKKSWSLAQLISDTNKKFNYHTDPTKLAQNFLKVGEYTDLPKMLVPFDQKVMIEFYEDLAKKLRPKILK